MKEIWKDIEGYEELYQVSNLGLVKNKKTGQILKPIKNDRGYLNVQLCKKGKSKQHRIHRLVAQAFIPNPDNLPCVNHKNENKADNRVENLEWCTVKYNNNYGNKLKQVANKLGKSVIQLTLSGMELHCWNSVANASKETGIARGNIINCCNNKRLTAGGYKWKYLSN